jgi:hypothetical protein
MTLTEFEHQLAEYVVAPSGLNAVSIGQPPVPIVDVVECGACGVPGVVAGTIAALGAEAGPVPMALVAVTLNV